LIVATVCLLMPAGAQAEKLRVTVTNLQPSDGFYLTPVWTGFHNGGFDVFDSGGTASASLEALAEGGDVSGVQSDFATFGSGIDGVLAGPAGFGSVAGQPPVLDPGESSSIVLDVNTLDRYLSFATMIIPSNDGFFGNAESTGIEVFDTAGQFSFTGPLTLSLGALWDAGTELNDGLGAPFSGNGGSGTPEANPIALHDGLANFDGTGTAAGTTINFGNASSSPVFRLNIVAVPEPSGIALCGLLGVFGLMRRTKRKGSPMR
jgi:hypothetical protein